MARPRKSGDNVFMTLRYPRPVRDDLRKIADRERRSLNEQIVWVLQRWLDEHGKR
jgi:hypothetical protein